LGESTRKSTWACCSQFKNLKKKKTQKNQKPNNKKIKIPKEAKTRYGIYLLEFKFTLKVGMYKHFNIC